MPRSCSARRSASPPRPRATRRCRTPGRSAAPATVRARIGAGGYTVQPGDTLSALAARSGTSVASLAAANGLDPAGSCPPGSLTLSGGGGGARRRRRRPAPSVQGAYTVRPGDTLSGLAAGAGVSMADMAAMNGLDPNGVLVAGTVIKLPAGAPAPARSSEPAPAPVVPAGRPRADRHAPRRRRRPVGRRRSTASPPRSPPRSRGRRAASTTRWSRPPTRAA